MNKDKTEAPKARKTRKKDFITVEGFFDKHSTLPIKLEIKATPEDWEAFWGYLVDCYYVDKRKDYFLEELAPFVNEALAELEEIKPRGKHKARQALVEQIKEQAGFLFPFFKYWCKKPLEKWPEILQEIVKMAKHDGHAEILLNIKGSGYDPEALTAFCIDKVHCKEAKKQGLKLLFNDEEGLSIANFYFTYIQDKGLPQKIEKLLIKGKSSEKVEQNFKALLRDEEIEGALVYSSALKELFESLIFQIGHYSALDKMLMLEPYYWQGGRPMKSGGQAIEPLDDVRVTQILHKIIDKEDS